MTKTVSVAADDLLPLLCYCLIQARMPYTSAQMRYIIDYLPDDQTVGSLGYVATSTDIVIQHILDQYEQLLETGTVDDVTLPHTSSRPNGNSQSLIRESMTQPIHRISDSAIQTDVDMNVNEGLGDGLSRETSYSLSKGQRPGYSAQITTSISSSPTSQTSPQGETHDEGGGGRALIGAILFEPLKVHDEYFL